MCWLSLALVKSHFLTKTLFLKMLGSPFGHHLGLSHWTPENSQVRVTQLASIQGQGEVPLLSGPADVPERAGEPVFRATASPQNRLAQRQVQMKYVTHFFGILSLLKIIIHIYLQNSPPRLFFFPFCQNGLEKEHLVFILCSWNMKRPNQDQDLAMKY